MKDQLLQLTVNESIIDKAKRVFDLDNMEGSVGVIVALIFSSLLIYGIGHLIYKMIKNKFDENNQV